MNEELKRMSVENMNKILKVMEAHEITELYVNVDKRGKIKCLLTDTISGSFLVKRASLKFHLSKSSELQRC